MRRLQIVNIVGSGTESDPRRPDLSGLSSSCAVVVDELTASRMIVMVNLPDGAATTNTALADIQDGADDWDFVQLTPARKTFIKNFLVNNGYPNATQWFDEEGINTAKELVRFIFRRLRNKEHIFLILIRVGLKNN